MKILLFVLLLLAGSAQAAAPVISCTPSQTSGVAPLTVFLDCTGTTDADTSYPDITLLYRHNFGDTSPGKWSYGANTARGKNSAFGPVAAHVYETAGSYTITSLASDNTTTKLTTNSITVSAASALTTYCFARTTLPVANVDGCPAGATGVTDTDIAHIVSTYAGASTRLLLKHDDIFDCTPASNICANFTGISGPGILGKYGSGAAPIIKAIAGVANDQVIRANTNWRFMDLEIDGQSRHMKGINAPAADFNNSLVLRVYFHDLDYGVSQSESVLGSQATLWSGNAVVDSHCDTVGYCVYASGQQMSIQGNLMNNVGATTASHGIRLPYAYKAVLSNNTITNVAINLTLVTIRAQPEGDAGLGPMVVTNGYSRYIVFSDNYLDTGSAGNLCMTIEPASSSFHFEVVERFIVERNYFKSGGTITAGLTVHGQFGVVRNNIFDVTTGSGHVGVGINATAINQYAPTDIGIYNNTCYNNVTGGSNNKCVWIQTTNALPPVNITAQNTLLYAPNATSPSAATDSTGGNTLTTNSAITTPLPFDNVATIQGFRILTSSSAASGGTATFPASNDDFYNCDDNTSNEHIGAFIPRTRANCRGVGQ